jgi:predicted dehydrogenase
MKDGKLIAAQIGCGAFAWGQDFLNFAANPHTEMKWACDISEEAALKAAAHFAIPNSTTKLEDIVNDPEVDLIKVCTSHEAHLPIIEAAAAKGKHIFCEKPMAMDQTEGIKIVKAVKNGGVKLCVDLNRRMSPSMCALKERWLEHKAKPTHQPWRFIETSRAQLPEEEHTQFLIRIQDESSSYRMVHLDPMHGGGLIMGETVHWIDLACWFYAGQRPVEIQAWGSTRLHHGINITFSEGDCATIIFNTGGSFDYPKELFEVTHNGALFRNICFVENEYYGVPGLEGEKFELQHDSQPDVGKEGGFSGYMAKYKARVENLANSKIGSDSLAVDKGHRNMLNSFVEAILNDTPSPCDELAGLNSTYLATLAMKSIDDRQVLPIQVERLVPSLI